MTAALLMPGAASLRAQQPVAPVEPPSSMELPQGLVPVGEPRLGVTLDDVTSQTARQLGLPFVGGAIAKSVETDSAAARAGLHPGDVILEFDGDRVRSAAELRRLIRETPALRTVEIQVMRGKKMLLLSAKLTSRINRTDNMPQIAVPRFNFNMPEMDPPPEINFDSAPSSQRPYRALLGIACEDLTPQLAQYFGVEEGRGALITEVIKGRPAEQAGLKAGDVIVKLDDKPISGAEDLRRYLADGFTGDTRTVKLTVVRDRRETNVPVESTRRRSSEKESSSIAAPVGTEEAMSGGAGSVRPPIQAAMKIGDKSVVETSY
jgi:serine protease Do